MRTEYFLGGVVVLALVAGTLLIVFTSSSSEKGETVSANAISIEQKAIKYQRAPEIVSPAGFINTDGEPIRINDYIGKKVVLIDFWTYTCINCQRTFPHLRQWYDTYYDEGLEIIGVHTPEFAFEQIYENVVKAAARFGLEYPIVQDNDYATWRAFKNQYWPRKYLIDIDGFIVYDHIGEGGYEETERAIQKALAERAEVLGSEMLVTDSVSANIAYVPARSGSPEVYFGAFRNEFLANGIPGAVGVQEFIVPSTFQLNALYLDGAWDIAEEYSKNTAEGSRIVYKYSSKDVYFVARSDTPVRIKVTRDGGQPLGNARGADVDENGWVVINKSGLYKLVEDESYGTHILEMQIEKAGLEAYTFTFG